LSAPRRLGAVALALALALKAGALLADPPRKAADPAVDEDLLEFLGTVDSTTDSNGQPDDSWLKYLAKADADKAAKKTSVPASPDAKPGPPKVKAESDGQ
jgi:hypothetical protein